MDIYLMIGILAANLIAIAIVYQFIKRLEKKQKLLFIAISVAMMYILISVVYWFSGLGVDEKVHEASKNFVLYLFVPVNVILFVPFFASQYMKLRLKKVSPEKFVNRLSVLVVLLAVVLVGEYFYFRNIQDNIKSMDEMKGEVTNSMEDHNVIQNEVVSNSVENQNVLQNELVSNVIESQNIVED